MESCLRSTTLGNLEPVKFMASEYWDSCLFLAYLQYKPEEQEFVEIVSALLRRAEAGETLIVVSTLVLAEIRPRYPYDPTHYDVISDLFHTNRPYLKMVALSPRIAVLAGTIGSDHRQITVPDAVHVATAWSERVDVMLTRDGDRDRERRRSGGLLSFDGKIGTPPLQISAPTRPPNSQMELSEANP